ncbi:MAG TPA: hypothetical protein VJ045_01930 [Hyphomicrobiaceae bacterium]|nr:hypothetical protein [Hyphomicrobiaceae bacterium]
MANKPRKRAFGRSLADFRVRGAATKHGLLPAEEKLLKKAAKGKPCALTPNKRKRRLEAAKTRLSEPDFYQLCAEVMRQHPERSDDLKAKIDTEPEIVRPFVDELLRFARGHPKAPENWTDALTMDAEALRPVFRDCLACFERELKGWRSVDKTDPKVLVRGGFVRFLALGGDDDAPVHEKGVELDGAYIDGDIDLECADSVRPLSLFGCYLERLVTLKNARLDRLLLNGSYAPGLQADSTEFAGNVFLREGFRAEGEVRLLGAEIAGQFNCGRGTFLNSTGPALVCDSAKVFGAVFLNEGFWAEGGVRLAGAEISGDLACGGGTFVASQALQHAPNGTARSALFLQSSGISRGLFLLGSAIQGSLVLAAAKCGWLVDADGRYVAESISDPDGNSLRCDILFDGFTYGAFAGDGEFDSATRKRWLARQPPDHLGIDFKPQPWEQLVKVYRAMGHEEWARDIARDKEQRQTEAAILRLRDAERRAAETPRSELKRVFGPLITESKVGGRLLSHFFMRRIVDYGYARWKFAGWLALLFVFSALIYDQAAEQGLFVPRAPVIVTSKAKAGEADTIPAGCRSNWTKCGPPALPREHPRFSPHLYSADLMFPLVSFGQEDAWEPLAVEPDKSRNETGSEMTLTLIPGWIERRMSWWFLRAVTWGEIVLGWILSFLLVAVLSGLIKKD